MNDDKALRLTRISRNVVDLSRSVGFYRERLGFKEHGDSHPMDPEMIGLLQLPNHTFNTQRMTLGAQEIELVEVGPDTRAYPVNSTSADLWFQHFAIRHTEIDAACERLFRADSAAPRPAAISRSINGIAEAISLPQRSGGAKALKFRDMDGHPLELLALPRDDESGPHNTDGIDHSAISVSDPEKSIAFYRDILGMTVSARQINSGEEQCRLDALSEDIVEVIALRPSTEPKPHVELLAYRSPIGRALEFPYRTDDIASDKLFFSVSHLDDILASSAVKPYLVNVSAQQHFALFHDPDGHLLVLSSLI
jgi:catechol 2,3-dioxygenase-like lactoylglutathione lyase family enzyme